MAYTANYPRLSTLNKAYGSPGAAGQWVAFNLTALFAASASRDAGMADSISFFADNFTPQVLDYKVSELMLFFGRYNTGRYQTGYTAFDVTRIGHCFFHEFLKERRTELQEIARLRQAAQEAQPQAEKRGVSREEYEKMPRIPVTIAFNPLTTEEQRRRIIDRYALTAVADNDALTYNTLLPKADLPAFDDLRSRRFFTVMG